MESRGDKAATNDPPEKQRQRMAPPSGLEQQPPAPAAAAPAGAGRVVSDRAAVVAAGAAIQRRMAAARRARAPDAFCADVVSVQPFADQNLPRREQLKRLKDELGDLQKQLQEALTLKSRNELKRNHATELISQAAARNERLRSLAAEHRAKRDLCAAIKSEELQALESLEAESNEYAEFHASVTKGLSWFDKSLGFRTIGVEEGVKFVFDKIDPQHPEKEYSFRVHVGPRLQFVGCDPHIKEIEELAKDFDLNEHLFKFVRMAREKFQSSIMNGTLPSSPVVGPDVSAAPLSSPMVKSVNSTSEDSDSQSTSKDSHSQSQSRSKNNVLPVKRGATGMSGASGVSRRRSPRLKETQ